MRPTPMTGFPNQGRADGSRRSGLPQKTFEKSFLSRAFFRGADRLDPILLSLLRLMDSCQTFPIETPDGIQDLLLNVPNLKKKIQKGPRAISKRFKFLKDKPGFNLVTFLLENEVPFDMICGQFPLLFENSRLTIHSLRLAWAFYLTFKTHRLGQGLKISVRNKNRAFQKVEPSVLTECFIHFYSQFRKLKLTEAQLIKCLKNSLCYHVSESLDQTELPQGSKINLIPFTMRPYFRTLEKSDSIEFFFSLLQSKVLCEEVPEDFVLDALVKHRKQLSSPHKGISEQAKEALKATAVEFGKRVAKLYKPSKGFFPTNKATFAFPRDRGGVKGDLVYHDRLQSGLVPPAYGNGSDDRMEPMVIGLFGQPGQGKSKQLPFLVSMLSTLFPGVSRQDLIYTRSCSTEHWDGYKGQPIVILDDLGQSTKGDDIREFQTLVSCNPYVLPMADLPDKGILFTSPVIIATSNLKYGMRLDYAYQPTSPIIDSSSFWRRFHYSIYVESGNYYPLKSDPNWVRGANLLFASEVNRMKFFREFQIGKPLSNSLDLSQAFEKAFAITDRVQDHNFFGQATGQGYVPRSVEEDEASKLESAREIWESTHVPIEEISERIITLFRKRLKIHSTISSYWNQSVHVGHDSTESMINRDFFQKEVNPLLPDSLSEFSSDLFRESETNAHYCSFPSYPPSGPLPVRVEPIREPLKVRTITAGVGDTFCLKPLQVAMWKALGTYPQFCLTHGTDKLKSAIERIYDQSSEEDIWISGDYSAATDSFAIEASKILMEGILSEIDHVPTKRWAMKEISPHLLVYPKSSGLEPVLQESGQLMGSLLSFPLLCLLNDCTAKSIGLKPEQYLINGDDILMRTHPSKYDTWKSTVKDFGLELSLGKNYVHKRYGTVNSQLIDGKRVTFSGKQKILDRHSRILGECLRSLEELMLDADYTSDEIHQLFKEVNRQKLSRTIRSIHVPVSHGGLSATWSSPETRESLRDTSKRTEILVYIHEMLKKIEPKKGCIAVPYLSYRKEFESEMEEMDKTFQSVPSSVETFEDFLGVQTLPEVRQRMLKNPHLRELFFNQKIETLPPLNFLDSIQIPFSDEQVRLKVQEQIFQIFFRKFLDGNEGFSYQNYRDHIRSQLGLMNDNTSESTKYLINILDLSVGPDFLEKIPVGYKASSFSASLFKKDLRKALEPKKFDLPICENSVDFSESIDRELKDIHLQFSNQPTPEDIWGFTPCYESVLAELKERPWNMEELLLEYPQDW